MITFQIIIVTIATLCIVVLFYLMHSLDEYILELKEKQNDFN